MSLDKTEITESDIGPEIISSETPSRISDEDLRDLMTLLVYAGHEKQQRTVSAEIKRDPLIVERVRARMNLSTNEMAKQLGIAQGTLTNIKQGHSTPTLLILSNLFKVYRKHLAPSISQELDSTIVVAEPGGFK